MEKLPQKIKLKMLMMGDGARGSAVQIFEHKELGVQCCCTRASRGAEWREIWTSDWLPDKEYPAYEELRVAFNRVIDDGGPMEKPAPSIMLIRPARPQNRNKCWNCNTRIEEVEVMVKYGWRPNDSTILPICHPCLPEVREDPMGPYRKRLEWVKKQPSPATILKRFEAENKGKDDDCPF